MAKQSSVYFRQVVESPLGPIVMVADDAALYILEFMGEDRADFEINRHRTRTDAEILDQPNQILTQVADELDRYFSGTRSRFDTPIFLWGTEFQKQVWQTLITIPPAITWSYKELAIAAVNSAPAVRAVAQANGANQLAIIVPCHRVIQTNRKLGGYGGGLWRKQWLLDHENKYFAREAGRLL